MLSFKIQDIYILEESTGKQVSRALPSILFFWDEVWWQLVAGVVTSCEHQAKQTRTTEIS